MIALYSRVSTSEQAEHGYSLEEQTDRLKKYCDAMGWKGYKTYTDGGFSGANTNRPALQNLIRDVKAGKIEKVLVYKLDRLSRSQKDTLMLIEDVFLANNCDFVSMSENFDTSSAFGRATIGVLSCFSQLERENIKERMAMGRDARAKTGKFMGSYHLPIGYDRKDGQLVVNEYEAMLVNRIYDEFIAGKSLNSIAKDLNDEGLYHKNSNKWHPTTVRRVLTYKTYIGYVNFNGEWFKGIHEPIMSEEKWNKAERLFEQRMADFAKLKRKQGKAVSYLGGFLYCAKCGAKYHKCSRKENNWNAYTCGTKRGSVNKGKRCNNLTWRMDELDSLVFGEVKKILLEEIKPQKQSRKSEKDIILKQIDGFHNKIDRLMDLYSNGDIPVEQLQDKIRSLNDQKTKLESNLEQLEREEAEQITQSDVAKLSKPFVYILDHGTFDEIRSVLNTLIEKIEIDGENITIYWRFS